MRVSTFTSIILASYSVVACTHGIESLGTWSPQLAPAADTSLQTRLASLRARDAAHDAAMAAEQGDYHLLGVQSYALYVPGLEREHDWLRYARRYGVRSIAGTREVFKNQLEWDYQQSAAEYATAYNRVVLKMLPQPWH